MKNESNLIENLFENIKPSDLTELSKLFSSVIITFISVGMTCKHFSNLKICRENKYDKKIVILPSYIKECNSDEIKYDVSEKFDEILKLFMDTINLKLPHVNKSILIQNLNSAVVKERSQLIFKLTSTRGSLGKYNFFDNEIIVIANNYFETIFHELLHLSSTMIDKNMVYTGFAQINKGKGRMVGRGLMEGYTSLLDERYFTDHRQIPSYIIEKAICKILEKIIGQTDMEKMYFESNLYELVDNLKKYDSEQNIFNFILNLDFINENTNYRNKSFHENRTKRIKEIITFLLRCYYNKLNKEVADGMISRNVMNHNLMEFAPLLTLKIKYADKDYNFFNMDYVFGLLWEFVTNDETYLPSNSK